MYASATPLPPSPLTVSSPLPPNIDLPVVDLSLCTIMATCDDVDEVIRHTKSLLHVVEDTVPRCKTLVEAIEESQLQSAELFSEHFLLHSLKGRLEAAHDAGKNLCKELLQFKFKLGAVTDAASFYERIQASVERKKDELEEKCAKIQMERNALEEEHGKIARTTGKGKCKKCSSQSEKEKKERKESEDVCAEELLMEQLTLQVEKTGEALNAKATTEKNLRVANNKLESRQQAIEALEMQLFKLRENYNEGNRLILSIERQGNALC